MCYMGPYVLYCYTVFGGYIWPWQHCVFVFAVRFTVMSASEAVSADPRGSPSAPRLSRSSRTVAAGISLHETSYRSSSSSPFAGRASVNKPPRRSGSGRPHARARAPSADPTPPWNAVLDALAELRRDVDQLKGVRSASSPTCTVVNAGAGTSSEHRQARSPASFSGFHDSCSDEGKRLDQTQSCSALLHGAMNFGPPELVSGDIDPKVAEMVNFLFDNGLREEDYKAICEDEIVKRPANCSALAPVDCNPQVLEALRKDAKRADFRLKDVNKDIQRAATIIVKSLLVLDKVAQDECNTVISQEVGMINGALALLGNANHKNNLARRFIMKRELNQKYSHLCSDRVPMSRFLFGDDVSQSAKHIEESEKLKNKIAAKKPSSPWKFAGGRAKGVWGKPMHKGFSSRFQPYIPQRPAYRAGQRLAPTRQDTESKNGKGRAQYKPRQ